MRKSNPKSVLVPISRIKAIRDALIDPNTGRLNWVQRSVELEGIKYTIRAVERQGYTLFGSLTVKGSRGLDLIFIGKEGFAIAEAKGGKQTLKNLKVYNGIRQGSRRYTLTRTKWYRGANPALAQAVYDAIVAGKIRSFVGISSRKALYEIDLNLATPKFRINAPGIIRKIE